jgi:hypothetical protein
MRGATGPKAISELAPTTFKTLKWDPSKDPRGTLKFFPMAFSGTAFARSALVAAFWREFLPQLACDAAAGICEQGGVKSAVRSADEVADRLVAAPRQDVERIRAVAQNLYTQQTFLYGDANALMRDLYENGITAGNREESRRLLPYVALLQAALVRASPKFSGAMLFRGTNLKDSLVQSWQAALQGGQKATYTLHGFTSFSVSEAKAIEFAVSDGRNAVLKVDVPLKRFDEAMPGKLYVGAAVAVQGFSKFWEEQEVLLIDATALNVTAVSFDPATKRGTVTAAVDWNETVKYLAIFEQEYQEFE